MRHPSQRYTTSAQYSEAEEKLRGCWMFWRYRREVRFRWFGYVQRRDKDYICRYTLKFRDVMKDAMKLVGRKVENAENRIK